MSELANMYERIFLLFLGSHFNSIELKDFWGVYCVIIVAEGQTLEIISGLTFGISLNFLKFKFNFYVWLLI